MADFLPPVVVELLADGREFKKTFTEAGVKVKEFQTETTGLGSAMGALGKSAAIGIGVVAVGALAAGVKMAMEYSKSLEAIKNQSGATKAEVDRLKTQILATSSAVAISNAEVASAYLQVEKAGYRAAKADDAVTAAGQAAWITGGKIADITKTIISVQTLQSAKGMDVASVTDLIVNANKSHIGSLDTLTAALSGKVGAALAMHNVGLTESLAVTDELSKAGYANSRAMVSFANAIGKAQDPTKAQLQQMQALHISSTNLKTLLAQPNGLIAAVNYLGQVSRTTGESAGQLATAVFGPSAASGAAVLIKNAQEVAKTYTALGGSAKDLKAQFADIQGTTEFKMAKLTTDLHNALTQLGLTALPLVTKAVDGLDKALLATESFFKSGAGAALVQLVTGKGKDGRLGAAETLLGDASKNNPLGFALQTVLGPLGSLLPTIGPLSKKGPMADFERQFAGGFGQLPLLVKDLTSLINGSSSNKLRKLTGVPVTVNIRPGK